MANVKESSLKQKLEKLKQYLMSTILIWLGIFFPLVLLNVVFKEFWINLIPSSWEKIIFIIWLGIFFIVGGLVLIGLPIIEIFIQMFLVGRMRLIELFALLVFTVIVLGSGTKYITHIYETDTDSSWPAYVFYYFMALIWIFGSAAWAVWINSVENHQEDLRRLVVFILGLATLPSICFSLSIASIYFLHDIQFFIGLLVALLFFVFHLKILSTVSNLTILAQEKEKAAEEEKENSEKTTESEKTNPP